MLLLILIEYREGSITLDSFFQPLTRLYGQLAPSPHTLDSRHDGAPFSYRKLSSVFIWVLWHKDWELAHEAQHADPALQPRDGGGQWAHLCLWWELREQCFWPCVEFLWSLWSCHRNVCTNLKLLFHSIVFSKLSGRTCQNAEGALY